MPGQFSITPRGPFSLAQAAGFGFGPREAENFDGTMRLAFCADDPDLLVGARHHAPLVVGLGDGENYLASDIAAMLAHTRTMLALDDGQIVAVRRDQTETRRSLIASLSSTCPPTRRVA